jgi:hypothetical protein
MNWQLIYRLIPKNGRGLGRMMTTECNSQEQAIHVREGLLAQEDVAWTAIVKERQR